MSLKLFLSLNECRTLSTEKGPPAAKDQATSGVISRHQWAIHARRGGVSSQSDVGFRRGRAKWRSTLFQRNPRAVSCCFNSSKHLALGVRPVHRPAVGAWVWRRARRLHIQERMTFACKRRNLFRPGGENRQVRPAKANGETRSGAVEKPRLRFANTGSHRVRWASDQLFDGVCRKPRLTSPGQAPGRRQARCPGLALRRRIRPQAPRTAPAPNCPRAPHRCC